MAHTATDTRYSDVKIDGLDGVKPIMSFDKMDLSDAMLDDIDALGFSTPTPVQAYTIQIAMDGHDVIGCARTGTGKTAAFLIPAIEWVAHEPPPVLKEKNGPSIPRVLVLAPTRELAQQIEKQLRDLTRSRPMSSTVLVGGARMKEQLRDLERGVTFVIATPGRLLDHVERRTLDLSQVETVVLDEADRMFDMGFAPQIRRVMDHCPRRENRQTLMFSATMPRELTRLANEQQHNPIRLEVDPPNVAAKGVNHDVKLMGREDKVEFVVEMLEEHADNGGGRVLIFSRTKAGADRLADALEKAGVTTGRMHADRSQEQRERALKQFADGKKLVLVATDIAARGLDVESIERVINYDFPQTLDDYIHRVGRTARAGLRGRATSLVTATDLPLLRQVEADLGYELPRIDAAGSSERRPVVQDTERARKISRTKRVASPRRRR